MVYLAAAGFLISIFPIHVYNYIYLNTEEKYASINITLFRFIRLYNVNTVKNKPGEMEINGKNKKIKPSALKLRFYRIYNKICIHKVVQISDYGMKNQNNAYAALVQSVSAEILYGFFRINGNKSKLKNYIILNEEHSYIRYYAKAVSIINLAVVLKILFIIITERIYELKK